MQRKAGFLALAGAFMAIAANTLLLFVDPSVPEDQLSYPLSAEAFAVAQVWFAVTQAMMAIGVVGLVGSTMVEPGRARTVFGVLAGLGMVITIAGEAVLAPVAGEDVDSAAVASASSVFGVGILLVVIGLIGYGVLAIRQRRWSLPWCALPLAFALVHLLVVTPVSLSLGFTSVLSYVAIALADALVVLIGVALIRQPIARESRVREADELVQPWATPTHR